MALEKQTRQIGEYSYEVTQFGAKLGNRVLMKVVKSIAPLLVAAASAGTLKDLDTDGVTSALASLSETDFDWIVEQCAASTDVIMGERSPGLKTIFDIHFAGKYLDELAWLAFVLEVNFGPFFQDMKRKLASAGAKVPSASTSPTTSTGPSSAS